MIDKNIHIFIYSHSVFYRNTSQKFPYRFHNAKRLASFTGIISNGGEKPNIIPEETSLEYYVRIRAMGDLQVLRAKMENCFESAAKATGCTVSFDHIGKDIFIESRLRKMTTILLNGNCICIWNLFPEALITIHQHWFGFWLGTKRAISHCLN